MTKKDDDSRIDTIGRAIARPQDYSGEFVDLAIRKFHDVFGDLGFIVGLSILALIGFFNAYRRIAIQGGILGWAIGLLDILLGLIFVAIAVVYAVFWRLDEGDSTTVLGVHFQN